jgi:hypothetical protein
MSKSKSMDQIPEVKNGLSINELIKEVNGVISEWTDIYKPITERREKTLTSCSMGKSPGATIKEALLGLIVTMVADLNMTIEDVKKAISFKTESPYIVISTVDKYMKVYDSIKEWVQAYINIQERCGEFTDKIKEVPTKATEIATNAPNELEDSGLNPFELAKVISGTKTSVSKMKNVAETLSE